MVDKRQRKVEREGEMEEGREEERKGREEELLNYVKKCPDPAW